MRCLIGLAFDVCTNRPETSAQPWYLGVSNPPRLNVDLWTVEADCPNRRVTVTFESESRRRSPSWSSLNAYTGIQQTAKRLCMLPRTLDHGSDPTRRQTFELMIPVLIKHGLLRRWPEKVLRHGPTPLQ